MTKQEFEKIEEELKKHLWVKKDEGIDIDWKTAEEVVDFIKSNLK